MLIWEVNINFNQKKVQHRANMNPQQVRLSQESNQQLSKKKQAHIDDQEKLNQNQALTMAT